MVDVKTLTVEDVQRARDDIYRNTGTRMLLLTPTMYRRCQVVIEGLMPWYPMAKHCEGPNAHVVAFIREAPLSRVQMSLMHREQFFV